MRGTTAAVVLGLGLALAACGPASISGTVGGQSLDASDAVYRQETLTIPFFGTSQTTQVVIGASPDSLCADLATGLQRKNGSSLVLTFVDAVVVGEYVISGNDSKVHARASKLDAVCASLVNESAGAGKVVVTRIEGGLAGTFDLAFGADRLVGSFSAVNCASSFVSVKNCL